MGDHHDHGGLSGRDLFFGRIVAGTSHELTNVLNIAGELAGLQTDLLQGAAAGEPLDPGRLAQLADRVRQQADRGQALLRHLNRFAHSVDHRDAPYDLGEALESLVALTERFARLVRARLELRPPPLTVTVTGSAFAALLAVFTCLEVALESVTEARVIRIVVEPLEQGARVVIESGDPLPIDPPRVPEALIHALAACPGELVRLPQEADPHRYVLALHDVGGRRAAPTEDSHAP